MNFGILCLIIYYMAAISMYASCLVNDALQQKISALKGEEVTTTHSLSAMLFALLWPLTGLTFMLACLWVNLGLSKAKSENDKNTKDSDENTTENKS